MSSECAAAREYRFQLARYPDLSPEQYDPKLFAHRQDYKRADSTIWAYFVYVGLTFSPAALIVLSGGHIVEGSLLGATISLVALSMGISLAYQADGWFKSIEAERQARKVEISHIWHEHRKQNSV